MISNTEIVERLAWALAGGCGCSDCLDYAARALPTMKAMLLEERLEQHVEDCQECGQGPLAYRCLRAKGIERELAVVVSPSVGKESKSHDDDGKPSTRAPGEEHQGP
jgi:hypothetical protein